MDIIQSAHYHALDPEFPWESYIYSMHMDRMTLLTHLRQEEDPEVARQVLESAEYIWTHQKKYDGQEARLQNWRVPYFYAAARYHAGVGSLEDVVKILLESAGSVAQDDYSAEAINRKLVLAAYLSVYAERLDGAGAQRYRATVEPGTPFCGSVSGTDAGQPVSPCGKLCRLGVEQDQHQLR